MTTPLVEACFFVWSCNGVLAEGVLVLEMTLEGWLTIVVLIAQCVLLAMQVAISSRQQVIENSQLDLAVKQNELAERQATISEGQVKLDTMILKSQLLNLDVRLLEINRNGSQTRVTCKVKNLSSYPIRIGKFSVTIASHCNNVQIHSSTKVSIAMASADEVTLSCILDCNLTDVVGNIEPKLLAWAQIECESAGGINGLVASNWDVPLTPTSHDLSYFPYRGTLLHLETTLNAAE